MVQKTKRAVVHSSNQGSVYGASFWATGVRLMSRHNFAVKASIISVPPAHGFAGVLLRFIRI